MIRFIESFNNMSIMKQDLISAFKETGHKNAVLFLGTTRTKKSFFINCSDKSSSKNDYVHSYLYENNSDTHIKDCLLLDPIGLEYKNKANAEIFNTALIKSITEIEKLEKLKIILIIPEDAILKDSAMLFKEVLELFESLIYCINGEILDGIGLIVARSTRTGEEIASDLRDIVVNGESSKKFHSNIKRFVKTILDENRISNFEKIGQSCIFDSKSIQNLLNKVSFVDKNKVLLNYAIPVSQLKTAENDIKKYHEQFLSELANKYSEAFNFISKNKIIKVNYIECLGKYYEENRKIIDVLNNIQQIEKANITFINSHNIPNVIKKIQVTSPFPEIQESIDRANYFITKVKDYYGMIDIIFSTIGNKVSLHYPDHQKIASKLYDALKLNKVLIDWSIVRHLLKEHFESQVEKYGYKFYKGDEYTDGIRNKMLSPGEYLLNLLNQIKTNFVADMSELELEDMMSDISTIVHLNKKKISRLINDQDIKFLEKFIIKSTYIQEDFTNILRNAYEPQLECKKVEHNVCVCESNIITTYEIMKDKQKKIDVYGCKIINLTAKEIVVVNYDLKFPGKTLIVSAPKLVTVQHGKEEYKIDLKGNDGENYTISAPDGKIGYTGIDGAAGKKGQDGGAFIGNFTKTTLNSYLIIDTSGGNGGNGQDSGNGGPGESGIRNNRTSITKEEWLSIKTNQEYCIQDNQICIIKEEITNDFYFFNAISYKKHKYTLSFPGFAGQKGLNPGQAGIKGEGGRAGEIEIYSQYSQQDHLLQIIQERGINGSDGKAGHNGLYGKSGELIHKNITLYEYNIWLEEYLWKNIPSSYDSEIIIESESTKSSNSSISLVILGLGGLGAMAFLYYRQNELRQEFVQLLNGLEGEFRLALLGEDNGAENNG